MSDDLVSLLRNRSESWEIDDRPVHDCIDAIIDCAAAAEIERLRNELKKSRKKIKQLRKAVGR